MKKLLAAAATTAAVLASAPSQASPTAYTYLHYPLNAGGSAMTLVCHSGAAVNLKPGQNSAQKCGGNGWVDKVCTLLTSQAIKVRNDNTGNVTTYGSGCSTVGGGSYSTWVVKTSPV